MPETPPAKRPCTWRRAKAIASWSSCCGPSGRCGRQDRQDATPLHAAAAAGQKAVVELLLSQNADPGARDKSGRTPKAAAAGKGTLGTRGAPDPARRRVL